MAVILLVPETKMADVGELISFGNLLVRKYIYIDIYTYMCVCVCVCVYKICC